MSTTPINVLEIPAFLPYYPLFVIGALIAAYLCGAIPVGLMVGRLTSGTDIREHGSGNTGTTNALRVLGWGPGLVVMAGDMLKGVLGCLLMFLALGTAGMMILDAAPPALINEMGSFESLTGDLERATVAYSVAITGPLHDIPAACSLLMAILGHMFSPFMRFKGGKGIATGFGSLLVVMPFVALVVLAVFAIAALLSRTVSVGSISAALSLPIATALLHGDSAFYCVFAAMVAVVILIAHRKNMVRLMQRQEPRFSVGKRHRDAEGGTAGAEPSEVRANDTLFAREGMEEPESTPVRDSEDIQPKGA